MEKRRSRAHFFRYDPCIKPDPFIRKIDATNPCGEVPLLPYDSCNLGSINLSKVIQHKRKIEPTIDWKKLKETIAIATRFLDDVIEVNRYLSPEIKETVQHNRKVGLGINYNLPL